MKLLLGAACVALAGGLLGACTNDEDVMMNNNEASAKTPMTFTAGMPQTRTSLADDGHAVNWTQGDKVAIYDGTTELCEFEATTVSGSTATLTGEAALSENYTAFYPYASVTSITHEAITFTLPAEQDAVAGGFAEGLAPSWAQVTDGSNQLQFHNLCALVKFTVGDDMAGEGTFTLKGAHSESLAGSLTYTIGGDAASVSGNASAEVKLSGTFEAGKTYYFVVAPATLTDGLSLFYKGSEGPAYRRAGASSVTFGAGTVTDLGTLTLGGFTEAITNSTFIWALGQNDCTLEQNADGSVTLTEACKQQLASITSLNLGGGRIGDLSDLRYFTGLKELLCQRNQLKTLDVSMLTKLTSLNCSYNQLETLDVSMLTKLTSLNCSDNQLETLDVSMLTNLTSLTCYNNQLKSLTVGELENLTLLHCSENQLETLDISSLTQLQTLICSYNLLTGLDVSGLTQLKTLICIYNLLTGLDVSDLAQLNNLQCYNNRMSTLDLTHNLNLLNGMLKCGSQTSDGATAQELQLTLPAALSDFWTKMLKFYPTENAGVTVNYPYDAGHDGFTNATWEGGWNN